jgi:ribosomal protein L37AE/L43A
MKELQAKTEDKHACFFCKKDGADVEHGEMWTCKSCGRLYDKHSDRLKTTKDRLLAIVAEKKMTIREHRLFSSEGEVTVFVNLVEIEEKRPDRAWPPKSVQPVTPMILDPLPLKEEVSV